MTFTLGRIHNYLITHRGIHSCKDAGLLAPEEADHVEYLKNMTDQEREGFEEFLRAEGFSLVQVESTGRDDMPAGSTAFYLVRGEVMAGIDSGWVDLKKALETGSGRVRARNVEPRESKAVWFAWLWLNMLDMLYVRNPARPGRRFTDDAGWQDAVIDEDEFAKLIGDQLEARKAASGPEQTPVRRILLDADQRDIARRVKKFLAYQVENGHLSTSKEAPGLYRQTRLGAVEIAHAYASGLEILADPRMNEHEGTLAEEIGKLFTLAGPPAEDEEGA